MKTTEKRHWVNIKSLALSLGNYGVMFMWGKGLSVKFYKLI